jgi:hypothetical protein
MGYSDVSVCKQIVVSILDITIGSLQYSSELLKQHSTLPSDSRGKRNKPNKVSHERKQFGTHVTGSLHPYMSHCTYYHNPNQEYLSPMLTERKPCALYLDAVAQKVQESLAFHCFCDVTEEYNIHFRHPKLDTCDKLQMQLEETDDTEVEITTQKELDRYKAELAQN